MNQIPKTPQDLFLQAVEQISPDQWPEFLDRACGGDAMLRMQVERLLAAHGDAGSFMKRPAAEPNPTVVQSVTERPGDSIGPYRLLEQIGEGGFGVVFMAEQTAPVKRKVALKVIKPGMDTREVIARFDAERQALALMDHPNIAKVFDAGATAAGRPFFVMELVRGTPITTYCDQNQLSPRERLELFVAVCQAVQHAHQKGIIHRDIKPTNVLVTQHDDRPVVKMIDFGIAKATSGQLTDKTLFTGFAQLVGTPLYMSPEQASLNSHDVDTRSDIYSLGVLLYELLTGTTPFDRARLERAAFDEIRRIIREEEPSKPSTRLSELGAPTRQDSHSSASKSSLASIAAQRHTEPHKLAQLLRGDLDWIVMKALEKDRSRRYETANGFAADVLKYLSDEPVSACPPSFGYRFRKFARRNKGALAVGALISTTLVAAVVILAVSNLRVIKERNAKDQALGEKQAALGEKQEALDQAKTHLAESKRQEKLANEHAKTAEANAQTAKQQEQLAKRRYYAAQMNLAMRAWQEGDAPRVLELLEGQRPLAGEEDLRAFEWHYLWRLVNGGSRLIEGHDDAIMALVFSPDGKSLFSTAWDWTVRRWDLSTDREQFKVTGTSPWSLAVSRDGKWLAGGSTFENKGFVWDAGTGKLVCELPGPVAGLDFSPESPSIWCGGETLRRWTVPEAQETGAISRKGSIIGISADGKTGATLVNAHSPGSIVDIWNPDTGELRKTIADSGALTAELSQDGSQIAIGGFRTVTIWDVSTAQQTAKFALQRPARVLAFSPDGRRLVAGCEDRRAIVWDIKSRQQLVEEVHRGIVWAVCFSPDGESVASGTLGGEIKIWKLKRAEEAVVIPVNVVNTIQFTPDSRQLLIGRQGPMSVIDVREGRESAMIPFDHVRSITPDGRFAGNLQSSGMVKVRELATVRDVAAFAIPDPKGILGLSLNPGGTQAATYGTWGGGRFTRLWDLPAATSSTLSVEPPPFHMGTPFCVEYSANGKYVAVGYQFHWFAVWEVATGKMKLAFEHLPAMNFTSCMRFSPDGESIAIGTDVGFVALWNIESKRLLHELRGHTGTVRAIAFAHDGKTLATAGVDQAVRLWDVHTGQERCTLKGHNGPVNCVQFSPDGSTLATASSDDGTVRLWRTLIRDDSPEAVAKGNVLPPYPLPADAILLTEQGLRDAIERRPDDAELKRTLARFLRVRGQVDESIALLAEIVEIGPDKLKRIRELADLMSSERRFPEAEQLYREAIQLDPNDAVLHARLGKALGEQKKFVEAEEAYRTAIRVNPVLAAAYLELGRLLNRQMKSAEALPFVETALRLDPDNTSARSLLGWIYLDVSRYTDAEPVFKEVILAAPDWTAEYEGLGRSYLGQQRYVEAEGAFRRAIALGLDRGSVHNHLGWALMGQKKYAEAESAFREYARLEPTLAGAQRNLAGSLQKQKKYSEAEATLREALRIGPNDAATYVSLGSLFNEQKRDAEAIEAYRTAIGLKPDLSAAVHLDMARVLRRQAKPTDALPVAELAVQLNPNDPYAHYELGWILLDLSRFTDAEREFREVTRLNPNSYSGFFGLGKTLNRQKRFAEAEESLRRTVALQSDYQPGYDLLGVALVGQQKYAEAESAFRELIRLNPTFPNAYYGLGTALFGQKNYAEAEAVCRTALQLKPDYVAPYELLKSVYQAQGKDVAAALRESLRLVPGDAAIFVGLGKLFHEQKRAADAEEAYRTAIRLDPELAVAYVELGRLLNLQKRSAEAVLLVETAVRLNPEDTSARSLLGWIYIDVSRFADAERVFSEEILVSPNWAGHYEGLGKAYKAQQKFVEAEGAYRRALALSPESADTHNNLGWVLIGQRKYSEAESAFREFVQLAPTSSSARRNLADCLQMQKKYSEAESILREALRVGPDDAAIYVSLARLFKEQHRIVESVEACRAAIQMKPDYVAPYDLLGSVFEAQKQFAEAEAALREGLKLDPKHTAMKSRLERVVANQQPLTAPKPSK